MGGGFIGGIVTRGLGEGAFFMSLDNYKKEIQEKLGFEAFPGTLNIKPNENWKELLEKNDKIIINGFEKDGKEFGTVNCFKAKINDVDGAIIIPEINKHKDIIEFIAPINLKSELNIQDGDKVTIKIQQ
jgi:riboflavin kinase, archaea type